MFNHSLKQEAAKIRENSIERYDSSYHAMEDNCNELYMTRKDAVSAISDVTRIINSISNRPKSFDTDFGKIGREVDTFINKTGLSGKYQVKVLVQDGEDSYKIYETGVTVTC